MFYLPMITISAGEFYSNLAKEMGWELCYRKIDSFWNIQDRIQNLYREQKATLMILINEAQYLNRAILADLKLLMNFEIDSRSYAMMVLTGRPVLNNPLPLQIHEALHQRIVINYRMWRFTLEEKAKYAMNRMKPCGVTRDIFELAAPERYTDAAMEASTDPTRSCTDVDHRVRTET